MSLIVQYEAGDGTWSGYCKACGGKRLAHRASSEPESRAHWHTHCGTPQHLEAGVRYRTVSDTDRLLGRMFGQQPLSRRNHAAERHWTDRWFQHMIRLGHKTSATTIGWTCTCGAAGTEPTTDTSKQKAASITHLRAVSVDAGIEPRR